jgi:hypothetical protein
MRLAELRNSCSELSEIAEDLGVSERAVRERLSKLREIEIAEDFLKSTLLLSGPVKSLKEYFCVEVCPNTNRDLDKVCPDVVVCGSDVIGLELTAYGNQVENQVYNIRYQVSRKTRNAYSDNFPNLQGHVVFWKPNYRNPLPKSKVATFGMELLSFVSEQLQVEPLELGQWKDFPADWDDTIDQIFYKWELLKNYALEVRVCRAEHLGDLPISVSMGSHTTYRGTHVETLVSLIGKKAKSWKSAYRDTIDSQWLLIHAARDQISSDIYPLFPQEIDRLLQSKAGEIAKQSDFDRVILWDGVDGGYVDLKNGDSVPIHY